MWGSRFCQPKTSNTFLTLIAKPHNTCLLQISYNPRLKICVPFLLIQTISPAHNPLWQDKDNFLLWLWMHKPLELMTSRSLKVKALACRLGVPDISTDFNGGLWASKDKCKQKCLIKSEFSISKVVQRLHLKITEVLLYSFVQPSHDPN